MAEGSVVTYRFLHLEDDPEDAEIVGNLLDEAGIRHKTLVVTSREEFENAVERTEFDLILSDFSLPSFNGNEALAIVRGKRHRTPFIFVSGTIGEDVAIESLVQGATDYVLKTKLTRLVPAVRRALREGEEAKKLADLEDKRQQAIHDLQASEARFRGLLESAPDAVIVSNARGEITFANPGAERVFSYAREELIGQSINVLVPERYRKMHETLVVQFKDNPHPRSLSSGVELFGLRKDGSEFPADIMLSPLKTDDEVTVLAMIRDTTAAKEAESALRNSEERFRHIYEFSPVGIISFDPEGRFLRCNPAALKILGYTEAELSTIEFNELSHPEDMDIGLDAYEELKAGRREVISFEKRYLRKDRRIIWTRRNISAVRDDEGKLLSTVSIIEDITQRKEAEEALRRSEDEYRSLVEGVQDAIFSLSVNAVIQSLNPAFEVITGWKSDEWIGKSFTDLLHPEDRGKAVSSFRRLTRGDAVRVAVFRIAKKEGGYLTLEFNTTLQMRDGRGIGILGVARDVTEQRMLEERLRQSQKLESIGTLAGGIAHDFNNILGIIVGYAGLMRKYFETEPRVVRNIDAIEVAAKRGIGLVRQLLTFARKEERVTQSVDVNDVAADTFRLIRETFPKAISMRLALSHDRLITVGDPTELHQAILNLCVNARDAMMSRSDGRPAGGSLEIATTLVKGSVVKQKFPKAEYDEYIELKVSDTGSGMDDATLARIFEPFFTTKEREKGTGLGLATVYGIVEGHEGFIDVRTKVGEGTTFDVLFPSRFARDVAVTEADIEEEGIPGGNETILIVEDEVGLREFLEEVLQEKGYKVLSASEGQRAIALFLGNHDIRLVLSDIGLPNVSGIDLLQAVKKSDPQVKVILASGFIEEEEKERARSSGINAFLQKPYRLNEVLRLVRRVLDGV